MCRHYCNITLYLNVRYEFCVQISPGGCRGRHRSFRLFPHYIHYYYISDSLSTYRNFYYVRPMRSYELTWPKMCRPFWRSNRCAGSTGLRTMIELRLELIKMKALVLSSISFVPKWCMWVGIRFIWESRIF